MIEKAESMGWSVETADAEPDYLILEFSRKMPSGNIYSFHAEVGSYNADSLKENIYNLYEDMDFSPEYVPEFMDGEYKTDYEELDDFDAEIEKLCFGLKRIL